MYLFYSLQKKKDNPARSPTSVPKPLKFEPPEVYKTEDYIYYANSKPGDGTAPSSSNSTSETHVVTSSTEIDNETVVIESAEKKPRPKSYC